MGLAPFESQFDVCESEDHVVHGFLSKISTQMVVEEDVVVGSDDHHSLQVLEPLEDFHKGFLCDRELRWLPQSSL